MAGRPAKADALDYRRFDAIEASLSDDEDEAEEGSEGSADGSELSTEAAALRPPLCPCCAGTLGSPARCATHPGVELAASGGQEADDGPLLEAPPAGAQSHAPARLAADGPLPPPPPLGEERYDGGLQSGLRHGRGRFVWANGATYEGQVRLPWRAQCTGRTRLVPAADGPRAGDQSHAKAAVGRPFGAP